MVTVSVRLYSDADALFERASRVPADKTEKNSGYDIIPGYLCSNI